MTTVNYATIDLSHFSSYETVPEMDRAAMEINKKLNVREYELLNLIRQKSTHWPIGIVQMKHQTMSDYLGISVSTVKRTLKRLENKGALIIENSIRPKKKGYGASFYIIPSLDYFNKRYKVYTKRLNDLSEMTYRKSDIEARENQRAQALAYIHMKKRSMNIFHYSNSLKSTQDVNNSNQLVNVRTCPVNVPYQLYLMAKPFLTDYEIEKIYNAAIKKINFFRSALVTYYSDEIIERSFKSLFNALRDYKTGRRHDEIKNKRNYILSAVWHNAMKLETGRDLNDYISATKHNGVESLFV